MKVAARPPVGSVDPDSAAGRAGVKDGDVLLSLDGDAFPRSPDRWLRDHQPEEHATVMVRRFLLRDGIVI